MSQKPKRKGKPSWQNTKFLALSSLCALLVIIGFGLNWYSHSTQPDPFELTVTRIISDATQTAVSFINNNCEEVPVTQWTISIYFNADGELLTERSGGRNASFRSNWQCDERLWYLHTEYIVDVFIETDEVEFASVVSDVMMLLESYPPDNIPEADPRVTLSVIQPSTDIISTPPYIFYYDERQDFVESIINP